MIEIMDMVNLVGGNKEEAKRIYETLSDWLYC